MVLTHAHTAASSSDWNAPAVLSNSAVTLSFDRGTVLARGLSKASAARNDVVLWDPRVGAFRAPAHDHASLVNALRAEGLRVIDQVQTQPVAELTLRRPELRTYQSQALGAWELAGRRGVVVLPTGAGKTHVALAAIAAVGRATLVLVPTRVLLSQWVDRVGQLYDGEVGVFGDGSRDLRPLTVCTFESAYRHMDRFGNRYALLIVDEVHHFGAGTRIEALEMCTAPLRLGLTATPLDTAAATVRTDELVGPVVCSYAISDLSGNHLAPFDVMRIYVELGAEDRAAYAEARHTYLAAYRQFRRTGGSGEWSDFVKAAAQSRLGRRALAALYESRRIVSAAPAKTDMVARLVEEHRNERTLVFTADNAVAYALSRRLLIPALTCDIGRKERESVLGRLRSGQLRSVISARVLNEGIDLPEASIGIIVGGTLGSREHVQRVGRLLRPKPGKRAVIYELVARDTHEVTTANRRQRSLVS